MVTQTNEATLCAAAGDSLWKQLQWRLAGLGYDVSVTHDLDETIAAFERRSRPLVLLINDAQASRDFAGKVLQTTNTPCALAVLHAGVVQAQRELLGRCLDFLVLPAVDSELAVRMARASSRFAPLMPPRCADQSAEQSMAELAAHNLIGASPTFLRASAAIRQAARCDAPTFVHGETGTGKELAARAIHYLGRRRPHPFIPVNCGAIPDHLLENELFGHERGAFTDAKARHAGLVEQANKGTLFLDEVDALSHKGQVTLLRFLQDLEYRPLGARETRVTDVRVVTASNAPLEQLVAEGRFRCDLWYRLNVFEVSMPPLRERAGDVQLLATHFLRDLNQRYGAPAKVFANEFLCSLECQSWPGNVRELENAVHRAYLMADGELVGVPIEDTRQDNNHADTFRTAKAHAVSSFEREYLQNLLQRARGNVSSAAQMAGMERRALGKLLKKHGIDRRLYLPRS